ncbi:85/88 kDa calcium-independent phospholipase A2 isoform X2 [Hydra vulgaris]|uniref:phospholipase A2 n=1 Tax=Hydra vulgaris TaxID=6087 RepID=A0ABM4CCZ0_HYDVU
MGVGKSVNVVEDDLDFYEELTVIKSISSSKCENVIRLYVCPFEFKASQGSFEKGSCLNPSSSFVVILIDQFSLKNCFKIYQTESAQDAEINFNELSKVLLPFVDQFKSIYTTTTLSSLIKLCRSNPSWDVNRIAESLFLPEVKESRDSSMHETNEEEQMHQQATIELILREEPKFAHDFFGSAPLQYLTVHHPELVTNFVSTIDLLQQTGKDFKGALDNITKYTESPIHVAIRLSQESVLQFLLERDVSTTTLCGHAYPIHLTMKHESKGCLKLLLEHDQDCIFLKDKKYNGSALHWAKNTEQIDVLASYQNIDFNVRNFNNETPLHIMVLRKRLSPCIALIYNGADVNAQDQNGVTPLHHAVLQDDLDILRCLLFLGADVSIKDNSGKTAMDYIDLNQKCSKDIKEIFSLFEIDKDKIKECEKLQPSKIPSRTQSILKMKTNKEAVLSLDGGGMRGLILTEILLTLETLTGCQIYDLFDWISGTSTGSFLALSIANGKSLRYMQRAYLRLGRSCLVGIRPYSTELIDSFLMSEFGEDKKMNEVEYPKLIIPAVLADRRPAMLHFFRNYDAPYDDHYRIRDARFPRPPLPSDQLMWLATRSSCSAPSYFRSTGRYLDGGLIANNPTLDTISEIYKYKKYLGNTSEQQAANIRVIVSLGTGRYALQPLRPIDIYRPSSLWDTPEIVDNLKGFVDLMIDQVSASDDHVVDRAQSWCEMTGINYFRFNPTLSNSIDLNEIDDRLILSMVCDVRKLIASRLDDLCKVANLLLGNE